MTHTWVTQHDTANRSMTHDFGMGMTVTIDWANRRIITAKSGIVKSTESLDDYTLDEYENKLLEIEKAANELKVKGHAH